MNVRWRRMMSPLRLAASIVAFIVACGPSDAPEDPARVPTALAVLESTLGVVDGPPEQQFASIADFLVTAQDEVWVLDGVGVRTNPRLRRYDLGGRHLGNVGGMGEGPGEFRRPYAMAELPDGRVVVSDQLAPTRLLLFQPDGTYDTTWSFPQGMNNVPGNPSVLGVGESGILWVEHRAGARSGGERPEGQPPVAYVRVGSQGAVLDTVVPPPRPEVPRPEVLGGLIPVPFQPSAIRAWSPAGAFITGSTDAYEIRIIPVPAPSSVSRAADEGGPEPRTERVIRREAEPVPISDAEREAVLAELRATLRRLALEEPSSIELPQSKPPLRGAFMDDAGRLWVQISVPSRPVDPGSGDTGEVGEDAWYEPDVFELYGPDGDLLRRIEVPRDGCAERPRLRGAYLWCAARGPLDVEVLRRYRLGGR